MNNQPFKDDFRSRSAFTKEFAVVCPDCRQQAMVKPDVSDANEPDRYQLTCVHCGLSKHKVTGPVWHCHADRDWVFGLPLYYTINTNQCMLCAFNKEHLRYIGDFVAAKIRLRRRDEHGWANQSQISRLPRWVKLARNRSLILARIRRLLKTSGKKS